MLDKWLGLPYTALVSHSTGEMMPNHVTNKIVFDAEHADRVFAGSFTDGEFDFECLVPSPPHKYQGDLSSEDNEDFKCNWSTWNTVNWGTKWGAYECSHGIDGDKAFIQFDTAWSPPYPVITAFANKFQIPFEHRYYDEGSNFWGIEQWGKPKFGGSERRICRVNTRKSDDADKRLLSIELKGYDPDAEAA